MLGIAWHKSCMGLGAVMRSARYGRSPSCRAPRWGARDEIPACSPATWEELKMSTKRGFRSWGAAARRFVVVGMAIGVFHVAPAAADLSFTLDLEGCSIGCDIPGM